MIDGLYVSVRASQQRVADLSLVGEIDLVTSSLLSNVLSEMMDEGYRDIAINMSDVSYCDCSGIRVLLATCQQLSKDGGTLRVCSPSPIVERIMEKLGLHSPLSVSPSHEESLIAVSAGLDDKTQQEAWLQIERAMYPEYGGISVGNN